MIDLPEPVKSQAKPRRGPTSVRSDGKLFVCGNAGLANCGDGKNSVSYRNPRFSVNLGRIRQSSCAKNATSSVENLYVVGPSCWVKLLKHGSVPTAVAFPCAQTGVSLLACTK